MSYAVEHADNGRLVRLGKLAEGGTSTLWLVRFSDADHGDEFALKTLSPHLRGTDAETAFHLEGELGQYLTHPAINPVGTTFEWGGLQCLPMQLIAGESLRVLAANSLREGALPPVSIIVGVCARIARALMHAHNCTAPDGQPLRLIHRDISPANIMIGFDGAVHLIDFGVAHATLPHAHYAEGQLRGKFSYMAPEQVLGLPVSSATDIFSLGTTLWELLTGRPLFRTSSSIETTRRVAACEVVAPSTLRSSIPSELDEMVLRCLSFDPKGRPSAYALANALEYIAASLEDYERPHLMRSFALHYGQARAEWFRQFPGLRRFETRPLAALLAGRTLTGPGASAPRSIDLQGQLRHAPQDMSARPSDAQRHAMDTKEYAAALSDPRLALRHS